MSGTAQHRHTPTETRAQSYRVRAGDTLEKIASKHHITVAALARLNGIQSLDRIQLGQVLQIPLQSIPNPSKPGRPEGEWIGRILLSSVALRSMPRRIPSAPYQGILADLPRGTQVTVVSQQGGWLRVEVLFSGKKLVGYVSRELVEYVSPGASKRSNTATPAKATTVAAPTLNPQFQTIEEFILFVEEVEREYPRASTAQIATEIRQLWFSDENWELLVAGRGVYDERGKAVDIETKPNPIAQKFDMKDLAPRAGGKQLQTGMGQVDIGHVMAGIDAQLNGFPAAYPKAFLEERAHHGSNAERKYTMLKAASRGDARDFTTWAGDLGQAYAQYLVSKYVMGDSTATLASSLAAKASDTQLLGDIHGYIAVEVHRSGPASKRTSGSERVSNILRSMYFADESVRGKTLQQFMEQVSGKKGKDLSLFIQERTLLFAQPWFAKKAFDHRGWWGKQGMGTGWHPEEQHG